MNEQEFQLREQQLKDMFEIEREKYMTEIAQLRSQLDAWGLYRRLRAKVDEIERIVYSTESPLFTHGRIRAIIQEIKEGEI